MKLSLFTSFLLVAPLLVTAAFERDLSLGSKGSDVTELQQYLARDKALYPESVITGYFGNLTKAAVIRFQEREKISPAVGYVGPKTRARLNQLSASPAGPSGDLPSLILQLEALQRALKALQSGTSSATTTDSTPPSFTKGPSVTLGAPTVSSPFGEKAPVKVTIDWSTDEPSAPQSLACTPELAISGLSLQATYWAKTGGVHQCTLSVEDPSKNKTSKIFSFDVPGWITVSGTSTVALAESAKLGELTVTNAATTSIVAFRINVDIEDALDAPNSRGKNYKLILKNGPSSSDPVLTNLDVFLHSQQPQLGSFHRHSVSLYAGIPIEPGSAKTFSIWIEGLTGPLHGGFLRFKIPAVTTIPDAALVGTAEFNFTK